MSMTLTTPSANPAKSRKPKKPAVVGRVIKRGTNGALSYELRYDAQWQDNIVQFFINGKHQTKADGHFYEGRQDAIDTAEHWLVNTPQPKTNPIKPSGAARISAKKNPASNLKRAGSRDIYAVMMQMPNGEWARIGEYTLKSDAIKDAKYFYALHPTLTISVANVPSIR